jgi:hypothetical protein
LFGTIETEHHLAQLVLRERRLGTGGEDAIERLAGRCLFRDEEVL